MTATASVVPSPISGTVRVRPAVAAERDSIYRLRHEAYATELGQHPENPDRRLTDRLDDINDYLVAVDGDRIVGFVSLTPPSAAALSIEKYVSRHELPFALDSTVHEVRLLTVVPSHRGGPVTAALMHAVRRHVLDRGGARVVVMGRTALGSLYRRIGLRPTGLVVVSGDVEFEILSATMTEVDTALRKLRRVVARVGSEHVPEPVGCFHGGASIGAAGDDLEHIEAHDSVVPADVLDAWFPPAPAVLDVLRDTLTWTARTSPPADCAPFLRAVAAARDLPVSHLLPGAGSSALVFLALGRWLTPGSRVLLLDPTYGEYAHVLEKVVGAQVDRLPLAREGDYDLDPEELVRRAAAGYDLVVLVNPNSPTGRHLSRAALTDAIRRFPQDTRVWIDETYVDYVGRGESLEHLAVTSPNIVVCASLSKAYALSGLRAAYLCGPETVIGDLRRWTPPWALGLPAQLAAIEALRQDAYYASRWARTHALRDQLAAALAGQGIDVVPGVANFLLCHLPDAGPDAAAVVAAARRHGVYLRDVSSLSPVLGRGAVRVAVRAEADNARTARTVGDALRSVSRSAAGTPSP